MAEKTEKNPRGAGRNPKPAEERKKPFTVAVRPPVADALSALARRQGMTRGQYIQRLLENEALKYVDDGKRGRKLGELYAVALKIAVASGGGVAKIEALRKAAVERPAATFPRILEFCSLELPRVTLANGREALKSKLADLTVSLGFSLPEELTAAEREAFEITVEKCFKK